MERTEDSRDIAGTTGTTVFAGASSIDCPVTSIYLLPAASNCANERFNSSSVYVFSFGYLLKIFV